MRDFNYRALNKLSTALAACLDEDRLMVMAQNPANHFHWSKSLGEVTASDLRSVVNIALSALMACEREQDLREPRS